VALKRGPAENRAGRKHDFQAPSRFYGNDGTKFPKNCLGTLLAKTGEVANTWRIGLHHARKLERNVGHSNRRSKPEGYAVWEIHPVMALQVVQ
jgi:hypothetical protein